MNEYISLEIFEYLKIFKSYYYFHKWMYLSKTIYYFNIFEPLQCTEWGIQIPTQTGST